MSSGCGGDDEGGSAEESGMNRTVARRQVGAIAVLDPDLFKMNNADVPMINGLRITALAEGVGVENWVLQFFC